jgi:hypothetical protein
MYTFYVEQMQKVAAPMTPPLPDEEEQWPTPVGVDVEELATSYKY